MMTFRTDFYSSPPHVLCHPNNASGSGLYRIGQPAKALREAGYAITRVDNKFLASDTLLAAQPDAAVFQMPWADHQLEAMERYRKILPEMHITYELDDAVWMIPTDHSSHSLFPADIKKRVQKGIKIADKVTVSTDALAAFLHQEIKVPKSKICVVKNQLSRSFISSARAADRTPNDKMRVGWAGGMSHAQDLALLRDAILSTKDEFTWVIMGAVVGGDYLKDLTPYIEFHNAVSLDAYPYKLGELNLDVGVVPLAPGRFNAAKSDLRVLEMAAAGMCVIASPMEPYITSDVSPIITQDWVTTLRMLWGNRTVRWENADRQHKVVSAKRVIENPDNMEAWVRAWLPEDAKIFDPFAVKTFGNMPSVLQRVSGGYVFTRQGTNVPFVHPTYHSGPSDPASISCISNDGMYPVNGQFLPLREGAADVFQSALQELRAGPIQVSMPSGPYVFFTDKSVNKIGLPDVRRYGQTEAGMLSWSAQAFEMGMYHALDMDHYVEASKQFNTPELITFANREVQAWFPPELFEKMQEPITPATESLTNLYTSLDMAAFKVAKVPGDGALRILLINGDKDLRDGFEAVGHAVLTGGLLGHLLSLDPGMLPNVPSFDLRRELPELIVALLTCGINHIAFAGLGEGSSDILGSLARLHMSGFQVAYVPSYSEFVCPRPDCACVNPDIVACQTCVDAMGSPYGYVDVAAWRQNWAAFLATITPQSQVEDEAA
jgi:hypothetical protein